MKISLKQEPVPARLQKEQVKTLRGPLDVYWLNRTVFSGTPYHILAHGKEAGYCILAQDQTLSAFYLHDLSLQQEAFKALLAEKQIESAIVSTRDPLFLSLCLDFQKTAAPVAYLFSDADKTLLPGMRLDFQAAQETDRAWFQGIHDYRRDFSNDLQNGYLFVLRKGTERVGYGNLSPNPLQPAYSDIGGWVAPGERKRGYGQEIILHLKQVCYQRKLIPSCGCDWDNISSKRMLEKSGFAATDRMLKVHF